MRWILAISILSITLGCGSDKAALREAMDQGTRTIRSNEKAWAEKLVAYPKGTIDPRTGLPSTGKNMADQIPPLTPMEYEQDQKTHADYENLVNTDRQRDANGIFGVKK